MIGLLLSKVLPREFAVEASGSDSHFILCVFISGILALLSGIMLRNVLRRS